MIEDPECPTCSKRNWQSYGTHLYHKDKITTEKGWRQTALRILFESWAPDASTFEAEMVGCERCSLMIYRPRPSNDDITAKYQFVSGMGDATPSKGEDKARTRQRANRIARILKPHLPEANGAILDYGGGDGRLLKAFVEEGRPCHLIDYADKPIAGVSKVGNTEADLSLQAQYSAIICSHVVEHLPAPRLALAALRHALAPGGVMYVEVPFEVFGNLPARREPVTHVNFFNTRSLAALLEAAGFKVISSKLTMYPHPNGGWAMAVGAIAAAADASVAVDWPGSSSLRSDLRPTIPKRILFKARWRAGKALGNWRDRPR